ncbi:kinesin-like protein KIN-14I isoform X2 [Andrographis paniculata]|uniref:kinesin-like protein KIN-14I isoform X2 n=1 Tax=Andrographis paniculata TaxID=175694 RepID=UPI0021E8A2E1|nr:kinesin-like protein KIN-14I isoform X2 [Andrographis paniculata]
MAAAEGVQSFSVASVVEDVLQRYGNRPRGINLDARMEDEATMRRYEAAAWLRKVVGVVNSKDLPTEPSEDEFRLGLRSGVILCHALNNIQPGSVEKVVESPCSSSLIPEGAALSAYLYFENVRNFLVAVEAMGLPIFEASDLERGGKSSRMVNCVLSLKSFNEKRQAGVTEGWKSCGNVKTTTTGKQSVRKVSEPFACTFSRSVPVIEKSLNGVTPDKDFDKMPSSSLSTLVQTILLDKKPDEIPKIVESVLSSFVKEFEHQMASQNESKVAATNSGTFHANISESDHSLPAVQIEQPNAAIPNSNYTLQKNKTYDKSEESRLLKQQMVFDQQQRDIKVLKDMLSATKAGIHFIQMKFHEDIHNIGLQIHGLAHAASCYHRVLEENRKLYNQVQDLKGSIRVYCRVRPFLPGKGSRMSTVDHFEEGTIAINTPGKNAKARKCSFNFDKVFGPSATQEEVYSDIQPLIRSVLDGYNVCIFAYGQTGSGKTYTMSGPKELTENSEGVNYRALSDLFFLAEQRKDTFTYDVSVQMIEIYNEQVRDLLVTDGLCRKLEIKSCSQTGLSVPDANLVRVSTTSDVIDLMNLGLRNRAVGTTSLNDHSSRSHSCLTVHVQGRDLTSGNILRGCMHLVDLAGSERVDKSEVTGDRLKEAQHINKSLSALGDVISSLTQKNSHVPYRNSKLTQLLHDSLGGQAKTLMFVHISPEPDSIGETISTLKFAERVATVELGAARVNKDSPDVGELKEQIASLKAALARIDGEQAATLAKNLPQSQPARNGFPSLDDELRKPMEDVGNIEVCSSNSSSLPKKSNFDLVELFSRSPTWPPVTPINENDNEDDDDYREVASGEDWVDKLMVNKQDPGGVENQLCFRNPNNNKNSEVFNQRHQRCLSESWKHHSEIPHILYSANTQFDGSPAEMVDHLDTGVSSSGPGLLNQASHWVLGNKIAKRPAKQTRIPDLRTLSSKSGAIHLAKAVRVSRENGRQNVEVKHEGKIRKQKYHPGMIS